MPLIAPPRAEGSYTTEFERPKGRLLLYWGCGAKAGPGQPVVRPLFDGSGTAQITYDLSPTPTPDALFRLMIKP